MSGIDRAYVTGTVIKWAIKRARIDPDKVAQRINAPEKALLAWQLGASAPTLNQAQKLADVLHIPYGYLFLPSPPEEKIPLPDFRTVKNAKVAAASAEMMDLLNDALVKQTWYREHLLQQGAQPLPFVGRSRIANGSEQVADEIRQTLGIDHDLRQQSTRWEDFFRSIIQNAERAGILVLRSGIAGGNVYRPLSVEEFRGFAISDPIAPLVFINGRDWVTAQLFTLIHELVHIWIGVSAISNETLGEPAIGHHDVEQFCNRTAAEILVPRDEFLKVWNEARSVDDNLDIVARAFKVSMLVALRTSFDLQRITWQEYRKRYKAQERQFRSRKQSTGGNYFSNVLARNSPTFTTTVVHGALAGQVLYRDAARLLNVNIPAIEKIARHLQKSREST